MPARTPYDFHYAVRNTEILLAPKRHIETFGNTIVNYSHVAELMDSVGQVRIREGRLQAMRPQIIMPSAYANLSLEGFGQEAENYLSWLKEHEDDIRILQYGYSLKQEAFSEEVVTDSLENVLARVKKATEEKNDPFSAVVKGVDSPWDVCLVRLFWVITRSSVADNVRELNERHMFEREAGIPHEVREEIEKGFAAAAHDPSLVKPLGALLQKHGLFDHYQDRFFALMRR